jgi:ABC-type cobalamin/Fe3+-siderophores transport system ATPase subunit
MNTLKNVWFQLLLLFMSNCCNAFVVIPANPWTNPIGCSSSCLFAATASSSDDMLSRGDARGAALRLENVAVSRGSAQILKDINFRVEPKSKWALVGTNGCGKSTLLKAIMEEIAYEGTITVGTTQQVGYLRQTAVAGSTRTIFEEAASAMTDIEQARVTLERAQTKVASFANNENSNPTDDDLKALDAATARFESVGGYQQEQEVASMLKGLGFTNLTQRCDELSGGLANESILCPHVIERTDTMSHGRTGQSCRSTRSTMVGAIFKTI